MVCLTKNLATLLSAQFLFLHPHYFLFHYVVYTAAAAATAVVLRLTPLKSWPRKRWWKFQNDDPVYLSFSLFLSRIQKCTIMTALSNAGRRPNRDAAMVHRWRQRYWKWESNVHQANNSFRDGRAKKCVILERSQNVKQLCLVAA
jgi:hypothetical protein